MRVDLSDALVSFSSSNKRWANKSVGSYRNSASLLSPLFLLRLLTVGMATFPLLTRKDNIAHVGPV